MKIYNLLTLAALATILTVPRQVLAEGPANGGGGVGIECDGQKEVEVLDVYEAKQKGIKFVELPHSGVSEWLNLRLQMILPGMLGSSTTGSSSPIQKVIEPFFTLKPYDNDDTEDDDIKFKFLESLPLAAEYKNLPTLKNPKCHYVQLAFWDDFEKLVTVAKPLVERLSSLGKVALASHEFAYAFRREGPNRDWNSEYVRSWIGYFLTDKFTSMLPKGDTTFKSFKGMCYSADSEPVQDDSEDDMIRTFGEFGIEVYDFEGKGKTFRLNMPTYFNLLNLYPLYAEIPSKVYTELNKPVSNGGKDFKKAHVFKIHTDDPTLQSTKLSLSIERKGKSIVFSVLKDEVSMGSAKLDCTDAPYLDSQMNN